MEIPRDLVSPRRFSPFPEDSRPDSKRIRSENCRSTYDGKPDTFGELNSSACLRMED